MFEHFPCDSYKWPHPAHVLHLHDRSNTHATCSWVPDPHLTNHSAQVQVGSLHFPRVNETQEDARVRFQKAIEAISSEHKGGLLVVTHGDALGAIVEHAVWNSVVYQVDTTGYVTMKRQLDGGLEVIDAEGVSWMAD